MVPLLLPSTMTEKKIHAAFENHTDHKSHLERQKKRAKTEQRIRDLRASWSKESCKRMNTQTVLAQNLSYKISVL